MQVHLANGSPFSQEEQSIVSEEANSEFFMGAVVPSDHRTGQFISTILILPKPNGIFLPVLNL